MRVRISDGACEVLCLDDGSIQESIGIECVTRGKWLEVTGEPEALARLAACFEDRLGPGWDQPVWYFRSARAAARRIRAALEAAK